MGFDDLPSAWQRENKQSLSPEEREATIARVSRQVERLGGAVIRRDMLESIAAVVIAILFAGFIAFAPADQVLAKLGAGLLVCWSMFIIYKLHRTRRNQDPAPLDVCVREFFRTELGRLDLQIQLLRSVLWWYIAPCILGVNLMFVGMAGISLASLAYGIATLLLAWGIYALNMRAIARDLVPARNELVALLSQLENGESLEQPLEPGTKS